MASTPEKANHMKSMFNYDQQIDKCKTNPQPPDWSKKQTIQTMPNANQSTASGLTIEERKKKRIPVLLEPNQLYYLNLIDGTCKFIHESKQTYIFTAKVLKIIRMRVRNRSRTKGIWIVNLSNAVVVV